MLSLNGVFLGGEGVGGIDGYVFVRSLSSVGCAFATAFLR